MTTSIILLASLCHFSQRVTGRMLKESMPHDILPMIWKNSNVEAIILTLRDF